MFVVYENCGNDGNQEHKFFLKEENAENYLDKMQEESKNFRIWCMEEIVFEDSK